MSEDGHIVYRRRRVDHGGNIMDGVKVTGLRHLVTLSSRWCVPYNPWLILKYGCHINVEIVHSVSAVKYLYKYILKGPDRVIVKAVNDDDDGSNQKDEITKFSDCRYISCTDALLNLFEFKLTDKYPPVTKLSLHLPDQQWITFPGNITLTKELVQEKLMNSKCTMLTQFFQLCQHDSRASNLLYPNVLRYYTYDTKKKVYKRRQNDMVRNNERKSNENHEDSETGEILSETIGRLAVVTLNDNSR